MLRRFLFANFKLVYKLNQWMRHRFTSAGLLILLSIPIAGIFGFDTRTTLSFQLFSITLTLIITSICLSLIFRGKFSIERKLPDFGTVDSPLYYVCNIKNDNNSTYKGLVLIDALNTTFPTIDEFKKSQDPLASKRNKFDRFVGFPRLMSFIQKRRGGSIEPITIDYIAENSDLEQKVKLIHTRRGYLHFDKISLARVDPLGLIQAQKKYKNKQSLLVLPKLYKTPPINIKGKRTYQQGGINNASSTGDSQEFMSLRDYRPGDSMRSIHWKSFAKTNHPVA